MGYGLDYAERYRNLPYIGVRLNRKFTNSIEAAPQKAPFRDKRNRKGSLSMTQQKKPSSPQQPNPRVTIISVILFLVVAFFVGQQFMVRVERELDAAHRFLITSEFTQAVEQDGVTKVVYSAGDYKVTGTYYPAVTAGSNAADAFNKAFDAMNARMATKKTPSGGVPAGVGTTSIESSVLGSERGYTSTFVGQDALAALLKDHPEVSYQVTLPSEWLGILSTLLPSLTYRRASVLLSSIRCRRRTTRR